MNILNIFKSKSGKNNNDCDTVFVTTSNLCPTCSMYNRRVYSLYGRDKRFPKLPAFLKQSQCPTCSVYIGQCKYFPFVKNSTDLDKDISFSNRPFVDQRTLEQKKTWQDKNNQKNFDIQSNIEFKWIQENLPDIAPKSIGGYKRMKTSNSSNFQKLKAKAAEKGYEIQ